MNTISVLSGSESIPGAPFVAKLSVLHNSKRIGLSFGPVSKSAVPAGRNLRTEVGGELVNASYSIPDNTEITLVGSKMYSGSVQTKRIPIRVDSRAPYNRVEMDTSGHEKSVSPKMYVEGRFWVVNAEEAASKAAFGSTYRDPQILFRVVELHPGAEQPKIEEKTITIEGEERKVTFKRPKRALRL